MTARKDDGSTGQFLVLVVNECIADISQGVSRALADGWRPVSVDHFKDVGGGYGVAVSTLKLATSQASKVRAALQPETGSLRRLAQVMDQVGPSPSGKRKRARR